MAQTVADVMTGNPTTVDAGAPVLEAARIMRSLDVGSVIVVDSGGVVGIVTDRDLVIRALAEERDPSRTAVGEICSRDLTALGPDATVEEAVRLMRERGVRRLPVVEAGRAVGIVTVGDLAVERNRDSALGEASAGPANQ